MCVKILKRIISAQSVYNTMMCAKPLKHSKIRSGMVLDNVSLTHHDLHDLCKPVDGFACDIIDIAVDFAVDFF